MERSKLATTTFTGGYLGVMIGLPLSAYLVSYIDWSAPFYFFGKLPEICLDFYIILVIRYSLLVILVTSFF